MPSEKNTLTRRFYGAECEPPELLFLETKWAALVSYGVTAELLHEVLPIDDALAPCTIREHVFTVTMRLTVLQQTAKGLPDKTCDGEETYPLRDPVVRNLERLKWYVWHENVYKALQVVRCIEMDLNAAVATSGHVTARKLLKAVEEFHAHIQNNKGFIPNYGERYQHGERISTGFVESTVNRVISKRFCKKQQMARTLRGAHLLLQIRTRVLNGDWEATFREWYPGFRTAPQAVAA